MNALHDTLGRFAQLVNAHVKLRPTLAGWSPDFFIQARDSGDTFQVKLADGRVAGVLPTTDEPADDALLLRGDAGLLTEVFEGRQSPLGAYTDGQLEVYGHPKDQIKLDVIALVLWGA